MDWPNFPHTSYLFFFSTYVTGIVGTPLGEAFIPIGDLEVNTDTSVIVVGPTGVQVGSITFSVTLGGRRLESAGDEQAVAVVHDEASRSLEKVVNVSTVTHLYTRLMPRYPAPPSPPNQPETFTGKITVQLSDQVFGLG